MHNNKHPLSTTQKVLTAKLSILNKEIAILWHLESETSLCLFSFTGKCGEFKNAFVYRASANLFSESSAIRTLLSKGNLPTVTSTFQRWKVRLPSIEVLCLVHCGLSVCVTSVFVAQWVRVYICVEQNFRLNCCKKYPPSVMPRKRKSYKEWKIFQMLFTFCMKINIYTFTITSIYQPTNAHIISYKTLLKHFKIFRHVSILSYHHQGA